MRYLALATDYDGTLATHGEVDRAYGDATLAIFPYKPGLDQSGTLLRALGAGVPAVTYDVGGLGEALAEALKP